MKKKLLLDILIIVLMFFLLFYSFAGGLWHEIIGILFYVGIIIHFILNYKIIINMIKNYKKQNIINKIKILLDILLFILFLILLVSGILMSNYIIYILLVFMEFFLL